MKCGLEQSQDLPLRRGAVAALYYCIIDQVIKFFSGSCPGNEKKTGCCEKRDNHDRTNP